jgi:enoyl-CoA hydratase/carnithine racemase
MTTLDQYKNKYENVRLDRRDGILQMTLHTNGDTLQWGAVPHRELPRAFADIGADPENRVVIMTGSGEGFTGPQGSRDTIPRRTPAQWDATYWEGKHLLMNLLDIEAPMISAINGPALRHSELPLLCDIVLATEETAFQDSGHFMNGLIPGDGMHVVYPMLLGMNRGRYFLLTGQKLSAHEAKDLGLVNEVLARDRLLPRAWELAKLLTQQHPLVLRYSRVLLTQYIKRQMHDLLGYGLALEGLGSAQDQLERGN